MSSQETRPLLASSGSGTVSEIPSYTEGGEVDEHGNIAHNEERPKVNVLTVFIPISLGVFLVAMDGTIVASIYAIIGSDLKQLQNTSWIATGYMLTLTAFQPLYGKLSDIFGRKSCLLFAYSTFGIGCLACGLSRNMTELIAGRIFTGLGGGGMTTVVSILISDIVPLRERGTWQGILSIIFSTGSACGAPLGGILADSIGWRWAFLLQVPVTLLAFLSVSLTLDLPATTVNAASLSDKLRRIDFLGAMALITAVFTFLLGLDSGSNDSWASPWSYGPLITSVAMTTVFALVESTPSLAKEPFAPKHIMVNPSLVGSFLANFFMVAAQMSALFLIPLYAQAVNGYTSSGAGAILIPSIVAGVSGSLIAGIIMQRTGKYRTLTLVTTMIIIIGSALMVVMAAVSKTWSLGGIVVGAAITTTLIALIANVTPGDQAVATAGSYLFRSLGGVVGIAVGSAVVQNKLRLYLVEQLAGRGVDQIVRRVRESLEYIHTLDPELRSVVRGSYEQALAIALWVVLVTSLCTFISAIFIREKMLTDR
ncbi:MFS general substrate transporter [Hysterangium stoloniferum]|nr:MFS general substrate transporter [Hysterangium stoloniferum]